jgi:hypothetical protein
MSANANATINWTPSDSSGRCGKGWAITNNVAEKRIAETITAAA